MRNHRITMLYFRTCSGARSQAPLCHCTYVRLPTVLRVPSPLLFWRRPPQSNYPPCTVPEGVRHQHVGGISRMTPQPLASFVSHLSYTSNNQCQCKVIKSQLFVPLRVIGIFTDTTISPSSWLRQCPNRYTIRAGRNLPDKEFRYLRTVIVTAAVYWASVPSPKLTSLNLPAPGRCQALYVIFRFSKAMCF